MPRRRKALAIVVLVLVAGTAGVVVGSTLVGSSAVTGPGDTSDAERHAPEVIPEGEDADGRAMDRAPAATGPLRVVNIEIVEPPDGVAAIYSVSPDGRHILYRPEADDAPNGSMTLCVQTLGQPRPVACGTAPATVRGRVGMISWSQDGRLVVFKEDAFVVRGNADVYLFDTKAGSIRNLTGEDVESDGHEHPRYVLPSIAPDGSSIAVFRALDGDWSLVIIDTESGSIRDLVVGVVPGVTPPVWRPDSGRLHLSPGSRPDDYLAPQVDPVEGVEQQLDFRVQLEEGSVHTGLPIDTNDDGSVLLLWLLNLYGSRGIEPNVPFFAVLEVETGKTAPLRPLIDGDAPSEERRSVYRRMDAPALSRDGRHVLYTYVTDGRIIPDGAEPDPAKLRLVRSSVESILDGVPDEEELIDDIGQWIDVEYIGSRNSTPYGDVLPTPLEGDTLTIPLGRDGDSAIFVDLYLRVQFERAP